MTAGCFSVQEVIALLIAVAGLVGTPLGIMYRGTRDDNKYLRELLSDQLEIAREQNTSIKATVDTVKTLRNSRRS